MWPMQWFGLSLKPSSYDIMTQIAGRILRNLVQVLEEWCNTTTMVHAVQNEQALLTLDCALHTFLKSWKLQNLSNS